MEDATTLLFDLDGFTVVSVQRRDDGGRDVVVVGTDVEQACPVCGVLSASVHARKRRRVKDLPHGLRPLTLCWIQRRWKCLDPVCERKTFAETSTQIGRGRRLTLRLREQLERAVSASTRSAADVAREHAVSWWSVNASLVAKAAAMRGPAAAGTRMLGVDETRARSIRWLLTEHGWARTDPWMTSFVDLDPGHPGGLLGLAAGRSGASVIGWLALQSQQFRDGITVVAVDPSAPFAKALRTALPRAELVVDHWHLDRLANLMVTRVRQRATQQRLGHRGRSDNTGWAYRRLLLRGARHLSDRQWHRLQQLFATEDPTGEIQAAWAAKECLRQLLDRLPATRGPLVIDRRRAGEPEQDDCSAGLRPYEIRVRLDRFYRLAAAADIPEIDGLAATVETWWPAVEAFLRLRVTNARTEGYNRKIKQIKRVACGFRNQAAYERRIMLNNAATAA
jgi:transposase